MTKIAPLIREDIEELFSKAKIPHENFHHQYMHSGGNNNIFHLTNGKQDYVIKQYKNDTNDLRDRLGTEWNFLQALFSVTDTVPCPRPISMSAPKNLALYSYMRGEKLNSQDISPAHIEQTCSFIRQINTPQIRKAGSELDNASEASFNLKGHLDFLFARLGELSRSGDKSEEFKTIMDQLTSSSEQLSEKLFSETEHPSKDIDTEDRILSPSDFGFHNALYDSRQNQLNFIDFEYAGWDDPAKLASDFFFQPQIPVDDKYFDLFLDACLSHLNPEQKKQHVVRTKTIRPIFGLRWCCIILKPYNEDWYKSARHKYNSDSEIETFKQDRLNSAKKLLEKIIQLAGT